MPTPLAALRPKRGAPHGARPRVGPPLGLRAMLPRRLPFALALLLAVALAPGSAAAAASTDSNGRGAPPSKESLRSKSMPELKAILRQKGAKCKKCVEKDDLIDRVIETWHWLPKEASSPDGKIKMTKEQFIRNLQSQYKKHGRTQTQEGHELDDGDDEDGATETSEPEIADSSLPDFDKVWADFSEKLSKGEIKTEENGRLIYQVTDEFEDPGWWERYKTHVMVGINVVLLYYMQHIRRKERQQKEAARAKAKEAAESKAEGEISIKDKKAAKPSNASPSIKKAEQSSSTKAKEAAEGKAEGEKKDKKA